MAISYKKLSHLLEERNMTLPELQRQAGFSANITSRLRKNEYVSMETIENICKALDCSVDSIVDFVPDVRQDLQNPKSAAADISGNKIIYYDKTLLNTILFDRTTRQNIIWATADYEYLGDDYKASCPITINLITGDNKDIIKPRVYKEKAKQITRTKKRAEVFTPTWICNAQNNLVDNSWFGREGVFNTQDGKQWTSVKGPVKFEDRPHCRWTDYVDERRLEITCGEAPYLVSRYDTTTGETIKVEDRVGLLDRKLRVVCENTADEAEWMKWAVRAFQSIYGFELQGDSLLIARENLLYTFIEYFDYKFGRVPDLKDLKNIAYIISWNIWQMDGLKFTVPYQDVPKKDEQLTLDDFLNGYQPEEPCFCKIKDWRARKSVTYADLLKKKKNR